MNYKTLLFISGIVLIGAGCTTQSKKGKPMSTVVVGSKAPDFTLPDQNGKNHTLSSYLGQKVALYFYPKDETPGCTKEACSIRDGRKDLEQAGIVVLGVSYDSVESHKKFADKYHLEFPLLSDSKKEVSAQYGAKGIFIPSRYTYLIDENGVIVAIMKDVNVSDHADEIIAAFNK
jgi:thioredoxin-dependent peroxiredoxin